MKTKVVVGLVVILIGIGGIGVYNSSSQLPYSVREIWQKVFDLQNNRIMIDAWSGNAGAASGLTEQEILNRSFDAANNRLITSAGGGGAGSSAWSDITAGTNTGQALVVGNGSSVTATGTGQIIATKAVASNSTLVGCVLGTYAHNYVSTAWDLNCKQVLFSELGGTASDSQIPDLSTLSTGLNTGGRCVRTDPTTKKLVEAAGDCGSGGGGAGFDAITSGTNTGQVMTVGNTSTLNTSGTGIIEATKSKTTPTGCAASNYAKGFLGTDWSLNCQQVPFSDLSGSASASQIPALGTIDTGLTFGRCVRTNDSTGKLEAATADCGSGSSTTPGGSSGNAQYNAAGSFGGSTGIKLDGTTILAKKDKVTAINSNTTLADHNVIAATVGAGGITLTLPSAASTTVSSYTIIIVDTGAGSLTLAPNGTDKINGVNASKSRTGQFSGFWVTLIDGTVGWQVTEQFTYLAKTTQIDLATCNNATSYPSVNLPTSNAPTPNCLTGTNAQEATLDFADSANQSFQFNLILPDGWTLTIDFSLDWLVTSSGGSNAVKWNVYTSCVATGESYDSAFNSAQTITTNVGSNNNRNKSTQTGLTTTGCAAGEKMRVKVERDVTDTFTGTARAQQVVMTMRVVPQP